MNKIFLFFIYIFLFLYSLALYAASPFPLDTPLNGIESIYTRPILRLIQNWPKNGPPMELEEISKNDSASVKIQCFDTPGNDLYIGVGQVMKISASLSRVEAVLDDFHTYSEIFDGLLRAEAKEIDRNRFLTFLEQSVDIPFVSNEKNEVLYITDFSSSKRKIYRYQLKKSNHLKFNDGVIVIEETQPGQTLYVEYDFWDADWGIAKTFASGKIWKDSIAGLYQSDLAIKLKAEHPDWINKKILEESTKQSKLISFEDKLKNKKIFYYLNHSP